MKYEYTVRTSKVNNQDIKYNTISTGPKYKTEERKV